MKPMTPGRRALFALAIYGVALGLVLFLVAPFSVHFRLPVYGGDNISLGGPGAIVISGGVLFAAFGAWGIARGAPRNGTSAILLGCAGPLVTGSPFAVLLSLPTLIGAFYCAALLSRDRGARR